MRAVLKAQINKTDRNDARGIAQMIRVGVYRPVHVKTLRSQKLRMLLTHRKLLQSKAIAIENDLRGTLRNRGPVWRLDRSRLTQLIHVFKKDDQILSAAAAAICFNSATIRSATFTQLSYRSPSVLM